MIDTDILSVSYTGNNSTVTGYPVTFPFLGNAAYVKCAVQGADDDEETVLSGAQYSVQEGDGGWLVTTATAYDNTYTVRVYRELPLTQGLSLPQTSAVSPPSLEAALDRLTMLVQQIAGSGGASASIPPEALQDVASFANALARLSAVPRRAGQLGVQLDDFTLWISETTTVGDWQKFSPSSVVATIPKQLTLAVWADAGTPGAAQTALAARVAEWDVDAAFAVGDNTYSPATFAASWAAFSTWMNDTENLYPALGNHDEPFWLNHEATFSYLPTNTNGHRRYYKISFGSLLSVYVLHSGLDSSGALIEPDGNAEGSDQHDWFVATLATDEAKWKVAAFHHPPFTPSDEANRVCPAMDWPELQQMDAIFTGHDHIPWKGTFRGVPIFGVSGGVISDGSVHPYMGLAGLGSVSGVDALLDGRQILAKVTISTNRFVVSYHDIWTGQMIRQFGLGTEWSIDEWGQELLDPDTPLTTGWKFLGLCPARYSTVSWFIGTKTVNGEVTGQIYVGEDATSGTMAAEFTIPDGQASVTVTSITSGIPRGGYVQAYILTAAGYPDRTGLQINALGRQLSA